MNQRIKATHFIEVYSYKEKKYQKFFGYQCAFFGMTEIEQLGISLRITSYNKEIKTVAIFKIKFKENEKKD